MHPYACTTTNPPLDEDEDEVGDEVEVEDEVHIPWVGIWPKNWLTQEAITAIRMLVWPALAAQPEL